MLSITSSVCNLTSWCCVRGAMIFLVWKKPWSVVSLICLIPKEEDKGFQCHTHTDFILISFWFHHTAVEIHQKYCEWVLVGSLCRSRSKSVHSVTRHLIIDVPSPIIAPARAATHIQAAPQDMTQYKTQIDTSYFHIVHARYQKQE
jgi:hypothetical protein